MRILNIGGSTTLKTYVKYSAKSGKWSVRGADGEEKEIELPTFVIDLDNLATGWMRFREGQAPERVMDPTTGGMGRKPGEDFKRGFVAMTSSRKFFGGAGNSPAPRSTSATRSRTCTRCTRRTRREPGQAAGDRLHRSQAMKDRFGTNYRPAFAIVQWVDRPADLPNVSPVGRRHRPVSPSSVRPAVLTDRWRARPSSLHAGNRGRLNPTMGRRPRPPRNSRCIPPPRWSAS